MTAHRLAYELSFGPIPPGQEVRHTCDNPPCCNPAHLILGSHQDNMADMIARGRHAFVGKRGTDNHAARLTESAVRDIRARYAAGGYSHERLARIFGISSRTIRDILKRETWRHVA